MDEEKPKKKRKKAAEGEGGEPKEHKPNWREVYATVEDIKGFLADHIYLRHNVITRRAECRIPQADYFAAGWSGGQCTDQWQPISDRVVNSLWTEMSKLKPTRAPDIYRVIESDFVPDYHPFRYYLDHLPPWDGQDYIIELSLSVSIRGGVEKQMLFYEYLKKWLVAMVAGWVDETVVNHVMLVLIGEQGSYKTTWFNYLLPPELKTYFYTKTNANRMGRDDLLTLAQYGLVCCEELDTMRPSELNQLKAVLTMPSIDERAAYAHFHEHRQHIASFCGTGNNVQFLSDETGNRRWLPFEIESIRSPREGLPLLVLPGRHPPPLRAQPCLRDAAPGDRARAALLPSADGSGVGRIHVCGPSAADRQCEHLAEAVGSPSGPCPCRSGLPTCEISRHQRLYRRLPKG